MEHFLINSSVCLFVLWLFYKLALENTSWHHFKRFYLLSSIGISLIIPFIVVKTVIVPLENNAVFDLVNFNTSEISTEKSFFKFQWVYVLWITYSCGSIVMLGRFIKNLKAFTIKAEDRTLIYSSYQLVLRKGIIVPHSFLNRIFVSRADHEENLIPKAVLDHEKAHLDQKHSFDILLIEALIVLFWFNPLFYLYRYSVKLNHEFLADRCVIQQGINTLAYQELILRHATTNYEQSIANTFHFPIIKKRFNIMKTKTSTSNGLLRSLAIIPVIALLILSCGQEETKFETESENTIIEEKAMSPKEAFGEKVIIINNNPYRGVVTTGGQNLSYTKIEGEYQFYDDEGRLFDYKNEGYEVIVITEIIEDVTQEDIDEYNRLAKMHKAYMDKHNTLIAWKDESTRMQTIYNSMTDEQRAGNEPWPYVGKDLDAGYEAGQIPPPPPPTTLPSPVEQKKINEID